mgnify:CR=1 FL=1
MPKWKLKYAKRRRRKPGFGSPSFKRKKRAKKTRGK